MWTLSSILRLHSTYFYLRYAGIRISIYNPSVVASDCNRIFANPKCIAFQMSPTLDVYIVRRCNRLLLTIYFMLQHKRINTHTLLTLLFLLVQLTMFFFFMVLIIPSIPFLSYYSSLFIVNSITWQEVNSAQFISIQHDNNFSLRKHETQNIRENKC